MELLVGNEFTRDRAWAGRVERVVIRRRALSAREAAESAAACRRLIAARPAVGPVVVEAERTAASRLPTPRQCAPYAEGLAACEYRVRKVLAGALQGERIRVTHWAVLGGESVPLPAAGPGAPLRLTLEPLDANPQVGPLFRSDTLDAAPDCGQFLDVGL
jgi:pyrimidine deaminase RibD-like protein